MQRLHSRTIAAFLPFQEAQVADWSTYSRKLAEREGRIEFLLRDCSLFYFPILLRARERLRRRKTFQWKQAEGWEFHSENFDMSLHLWTTWDGSTLPWLLGEIEGERELERMQANRALKRWRLLFTKEEDKWWTDTKKSNASLAQENHGRNRRACSLHCNIVNKHGYRDASNRRRIGPIPIITAEGKWVVWSSRCNV